MRIEQYNGNRNEWDEYVRNSPNATIYHQIEWKEIIENFFGHKAYYLMAKEDDNLQGVLPLFLMKSSLFGKFIVSLPFHCIGGVCTDDETTRKNLVEAAVRLTKEEGADYLELRTTDNVEAGLITRDHKASFVLDLNPGIDEIWALFKKQTRNRIRKAEKSDLTVKFGHEYIKEFYNCNARHMRDLGLPGHKFDFFKKVLEIFPQDSQIAIIVNKGKTIAAKFFMFYKNKVYLIWGASSKSAKELMPNYLLTWEVIKYAAGLGYRYCDFGRSTVDTGPYYFKESWGGELKPLYWQYYLNNGAKIPNLSPSNSKYNFAISIWKKLPVSIANLIGPKIVKYIP